MAWRIIMQNPSSTKMQRMMKNSCCYVCVSSFSVMSMIIRPSVKGMMISQLKKKLMILSGRSRNRPSDVS